MAFLVGGDSIQFDPTASGAKEISNGYASGDSNNELYSKVAQKILWNFTGTSSLTIHGAKATNVTVNRKHANQEIGTLTRRRLPSALPPM